MVLSYISHPSSPLLAIKCPFSPTSLPLDYWHVWWWVDNRPPLPSLHGSMSNRCPSTIVFKQGSGIIGLHFRKTPWQRRGSLISGVSWEKLYSFHHILEGYLYESGGTGKKLIWTKKDEDGNIYLLSSPLVKDERKKQRRKRRGHCPLKAVAKENHLSIVPIRTEVSILHVQSWI